MASSEELIGGGAIHLTEACAVWVKAAGLLVATVLSDARTDGEEAWQAMSVGAPFEPGSLRVKNFLGAPLSSTRQTADARDRGLDILEINLETHA